MCLEHVLHWERIASRGDRPSHPIWLVRVIGIKCPRWPGNGVVGNSSCLVGLQEVISALGFDSGRMTGRPEVIIVWSCNETTLPPQGNSLDWFQPPYPSALCLRILSTPQRRHRRIGCNADVCNETVVKKAPDPSIAGGVSQSGRREEPE